MTNEITNPEIKKGLWTIVIELNNYADNIIFNSDEIMELTPIKEKYYNAENVNRIRYFDRENKTYMYREF